MKQDNDKTRWDLLDWPAMDEMAKIMTIGAATHGNTSWRETTDGLDRYFSAAMRHLSAWKKGENRDRDSGQRHLVHAMCNMMILCDLTRCCDVICPPLPETLPRPVPDPVRDLDQLLSTPPCPRPPAPDRPGRWAVPT